MQLTVAAIVKNEADKFLPKAVAAWTAFADRVCVIDDGSTDATPDVLNDAGVEWKREPHGLWGNEHAARKALWDYACPGSEWVMILDADMVPMDDPKPVLAGGVGAFRLADMWSPTHYRSDAWWCAHERLQMWAARVNGRTEWSWDRQRTIHADRMPDVSGCGPIAEVGVLLLHYAYASPALREKKADQYKAIWDQLTPKERFHAGTILDESPNLIELPNKPRWPLL